MCRDNTWEIVIVGQSNDINTGVFLDFGQWNDIAVVLNNDSLFVYKNGQQLYSTMNIYNTASGTDLFIGSNTQDRLDEFFGGKIDNLHIWDLALTQQEIQQYISCLPSSGETGLVGYWNFEEGTGTTTYDQTVNDNDGTINGAIFSSDVRDQACELTTVNGCDSVAVLNLAISQPDTSFTEFTACESYEWNGTTYTESGSYEYSEQNYNEFSISFDGQSGNYIEVDNFHQFNDEITIAAWVLFNDSTDEDMIIEKYESTWGNQFPNSTGWYLRKEQKKLRWVELLLTVR